MKKYLKTISGRGAAKFLPQCRYRNCILILAHMRCGSTALSNILCSRAEVRGYGEAHIRYDGRDALGRLVVNQTLRSGRSLGALYLFDKILHSRYDEDAPAEFFDARAIFVARSPKPAIRSIRKLFAGLGNREYETDTDAAEYYLERLNRLMVLWQKFPAHRRIGLTHLDLLSDPQAQLNRISARLEIHPRLENHYVSVAASRKGGGGDPTTSGRYTRIEPQEGTMLSADRIVLNIAPELEIAVEEAYARFVHLTSDA
ncbi:sulfotransferase family protein [Salipiger sp. CCB-MM3]|uniref:sulfotransferase family protein n=1 Tax=Salipiger sp. CCB-MM3 TaxID=1792508 RepID=UPI0009F4B785|nr:sulfotransferase [Salipiger sp. CCB-MM3]